MKTKRERLEDLLSTLTVREESILEGYFLSDRTLRDISRELGICPQRGGAIRDHALRKLRHSARQKYLRDEITFDQLLRMLPSIPSVML